MSSFCTVCMVRRGGNSPCIHRDRVSSPSVHHRISPTKAKSSTHQHLDRTTAQLLQYAALSKPTAAVTNSELTSTRQSPLKATQRPSTALSDQRRNETTHHGERREVECYNTHHNTSDVTSYLTEKRNNSSRRETRSRVLQHSSQHSDVTSYLRRRDVQFKESLRHDDSAAPSTSSEQESRWIPPSAHPHPTTDRHSASPKPRGRSAASSRDVSGVMTAHSHTLQTTRPYHCHCTACPSMVADVAAKQHKMDALLEMIRAGFLDLCEAIRADVHELRSDVDDRFRRQEVHLMEAVRKAISQERRYHDLLERERQEEVTKQHLDARVHERVGAVQDSVAASIAHVERQLRSLELRVASNEEASDYQHRAKRHSSTSLRHEDPPIVTDTTGDLEQQRTLRGELR
ncbi:Hypothetical protein, putative, partial [Bodo saltans]